MSSTVECAVCGATVAAGASFCLRCGARAVVACSTCGAPNPSAARFCAQCGAPAIAQAALDPERRQITVLFCDLVGSTALAARLDPEDMREVIRAFQNACVAVMPAFEGFIAKFMGDGILAYFGYPLAHEDDAERAVRAGLEMIARVAALETAAGEPLKTRIGIATGVVVIGDLVRHGTAMDRPVIGETPNVAARLKDLAEPDTMVIADATRRLLKGMFGLRRLGPVAIKGYADPVAAWIIRREGPSHGRVGVLQARRATAFVGREPEKQLLLEKKRLAWQGNGQAVLISGEAGVGKSRLAAWLAYHIADEPHTTLRYQCSPYHTDSTFYPVAMQMLHAAGIKPEDSPEQRFAKLETLLAPISANLAQSLPLMGAMLSIPFTERYPAPALSATQQRRRTFVAHLEQLEALARLGPVLLLFEDLQWADATSLELSQLALARIRRLPILAVVTFRPEFETGRFEEPHVTRLALGRLGEGEAATLARAVPGAEALPDEAIEQIVARADGMPLFIEEVTKAVLECDQTGGRVIPATLRDSLTARLDRSAPVKEIAQIAAVIGRDFSYELLRKVSQAEDRALGAALEQLERAGLLYHRQAPPQQNYRFNHALVQEAAYESLLRSQRIVLHRRIAEALSESFPAVAAQEPEVVAHHFTQAGRPEIAVEWWQRAGERALHRSAFVEAIAQLGRALELSPPQPERAAERMQRLRLLVAYGQALMATRGSAAPETAAAFGQARELVAGIDDARQRFSIYYGLWAGSNTRGEAIPSRQMAEAFLEEAERHPESAELGIAHRLLGTTCGLEGRYVEAKQHLERALALYDPERDAKYADSFAQDLRVAAELNLALVLWPLGEVERACRVAEQAAAHAVEGGHVPTLAFAHAYMCGFQAMRRDPVRAAPHAEALVALGRQHAMQWWLISGMFFHGWTRWHAGEREAGRNEMLEAAALCRAHGVSSLPRGLEILLAESEAAEGLIEAALARVDDSFAEVRATGARWQEPELLRHRAELLAKLNPAYLRAAETHLLDAINIARSQNARSYELRACLALARLYHASNRNAAARELLTPILPGFGKSRELPELAQAARFL